MTDRIAVLLNPSAGNGRALRNKDRLESTLKSNSVSYDLFVSGSMRNLVDLAKRTSRDYERVVAVGGDSTFDIVLREILIGEKDNTLGMVGLGSSNDITREFGLFDIESACSAIRKGITNRVDVGQLSSDEMRDSPAYFLGTASLGLGTAVNRWVNQLVERHPYLHRYQSINGFFGAYAAFSNGDVPQRVAVEYGGKQIEFNLALMVFNNTRYYASGLELNPGANPFDGRLNAYIIETDSFLDFFTAYCLSRRQQHTKRRNVHLLESEGFGIYSERGIEIQADGEIAGPYKKMSLSVKPSALKVIVNAG